MNFFSQISINPYFINFCFGFISGFTLLIGSQSVNFWISKASINNEIIGIFAFCTIPYSINFLFAPIIEIYKLPYFEKIFGKYKGYTLLFQIILIILTYFISLLNPSNNLTMLFIVSFLVSIFSSLQDVTLNSLRANLFDKNKFGELSGIYVIGYRIGLLTSGSGSILISSVIGWNKVYLIYSLSVFIFIFIILNIKTQNTKIKSNNSDINSNNSNVSYKNISKAIFENIKPYYFVFIIFLFLVLYRLPDNFISTMINRFMLDIGFNDQKIAIIGKFHGVISAIFGSLIASIIMKNLNISKSLFLFGLIHAFGHLLFILQLNLKDNIYSLFFIVAFESISGGMSMAAYIAFITYLCRGNNSAIKYAFYSSSMGFSRSIFPAFSGYIVSYYGWELFFIITTIIALPSIFMVYYAKLDR